MKKLMLFFVITLFISCRNEPNDKIVSMFNKLIKTDAIEKKFNEKESVYTWEKRSLGLDTELKNLIDKEIGVIGNKGASFEFETDINGNRIPDRYVTTYIWENPELKISLEFYFKGSNAAETKLFYVKK